MLVKTLALCIFILVLPATIKWLVIARGALGSSLVSGLDGVVPPDKEWGLEERLGLQSTVWGKVAPNNPHAWIVLRRIPKPEYGIPEVEATSPSGCGYSVPLDVVSSTGGDESHEKRGNSWQARGFPVPGFQTLLTISFCAGMSRILTIREQPPPAEAIRLYIIYKCNVLVRPWLCVFSFLCFCPP